MRASRARPLASSRARKGLDTRDAPLPSSHPWGPHCKGCPRPFCRPFPEARLQPCRRLARSFPPPTAAGTHFRGGRSASSPPRRALRPTRCADVAGRAGSRRGAAGARERFLRELGRRRHKAWPAKGGGRAEPHPRRGQRADGRGWGRRGPHLSPALARPRERSVTTTAPPLVGSAESASFREPASSGGRVSGRRRPA